MGSIMEAVVFSLDASIGWFVGFVASFTPAQRALADPARQ